MASADCFGGEGDEPIILPSRSEAEAPIAASTWPAGGGLKPEKYLGSPRMKIAAPPPGPPQASRRRWSSRSGASSKKILAMRHWLGRT